MLEKMGWSKGKGLGADLNGQQDFVKVSYKLDQKGFGFTERDDQWTQHEDQFNSLLKSFDDNSKSNSGDDQSAAADQQATGTRTSGLSLEELSKKSKARVHYKKFTRGKDMTRYNEKDLANIFGRRTLDEPTAVADPVEIAGHEDADVFDEKSTPNFGITTIETGISVNDYFRRKLAAIRGENIDTNDNQIEESTESSNKSEKAQADVDCDGQLADRHQKRNKRKHKNRTEETGAAAAALEATMTEESDRIKTKKSKRKNEPMTNEWNDLPMAICDEENSNPPKRAKKSKRKRESDDKLSLEIVNGVAHTETITAQSDSDKTMPPTTNTELQLNDYVDSLVRLAHIFAKGRSNETDNDLQAMSLETTYNLTSFKAELFKVLDLNGFNNSTLTHISGYGYSTDIQLNITASAKDEHRLANFWDKALEQKYGAKVLKAGKKKRYSIARLQKKNMFKGIS